MKILHFRPERPFLLLLLSSTLATPGWPAADESGAQHVRESEPLTPDEQRETFRLPPGFTIELFAAEPDIGKPINMDFDAAGRLWVTQSSEYPVAAAAGKGSDRITVLEDTTGDGRADTFTDFADDLNIPIGIHPLTGGAIAFSIPYVLRFFDRDGDLVADERSELIGAFDFVDTHGLVNNLVRGFDGWIHACHGFRNESTVSALDGREVTMRSGNTFRFPPDGSRMEVTTTGRVNPFGQAYDDWGYLYSSDCHSTPIYQLIRGADYPTFQRGPSGIGYAPKMMEHKHGPTAISGLALYTADQFPKEYRHNFFAGNVVSNRVKRDSIEWRGSTPFAIPEPDFLVSDDPWFRPADIKVGPDGALYVADFYNRIIGHYEVPLDHPGRDRHRGRIWRITYRADSGEVPGPGATDWSQAELDELLTALGHSNLTTRFLVANQVADRIGAAATQPLLDLWANENAKPSQHVMVLWLLHRLDRLPFTLLQEAALSPAEPVRVHAMRLLTEFEEPDEARHELAMAALDDDSPHVRRAAVEALARHPKQDNVRLLLDLRHEAAEEDTHLVYTIRQGLRDTLRDAAVLARIVSEEWSAADSAALADAVTGVDHPGAGDFLITHLQRHAEPPALTQRYLRHAALHVSEGKLTNFTALAREVAKGDPPLEMTLLESMAAATRQRGLNLPEAARAWGEAIASAALEVSADAAGWRYFPHPEEVRAGDPWAVTPTPSQDEKTVPFLSSRPIDEEFTGSLRSTTFEAPENLSFFIAGHAGVPDQPPHDRNRILLRAADNDEILMEARPPRIDTAQPVDWDLRAHKGRSAYFELVDGDSAPHYAWLAAGRFDPPVVAVPSTGTGEIARKKIQGVGLAEGLKLQALVPQLQNLLSDKQEAKLVRLAAAEALGEFDLPAAVPFFAAVLKDAAESDDLKRAAALLLARSDAHEARAALRESLPDAPHPLQVAIATELARTAGGRAWLLDAVEEKIAPASVLRERIIEERLLAALDSSQTQRFQQLAAEAAPIDERLQQVIDESRRSFDAALAQPEKGERVFAVHCAACHEVGGRGGRIGPQLDGIGKWGVARLIEKIIDPNRNVSQAFRYSTLTLADGRTFTGLLQREEGETLVFADAAGREESIPKADIVKQTESRNSLMPPIFADALSDEDLHNLVGYLLTLE